MKLVIDEKLKHRITGIAVIISLGAIFAPVMMKKANQNVESRYVVQVKIPPKPESAQVAMSDEKELFKTIKVARVAIPKVTNENQLPDLAKAARISSDVVAVQAALAKNKASAGVPVESTQIAVNQSAQSKAKQMVQMANQAKKAAPIVALKKSAAPPKASIAKTVVKQPVRPSIKSDVYALQLASFSQLNNAKALVNRLQHKGYKANFIKAQTGQQVIYKVLAGHSTHKEDVLKLKTQLAQAMQINGFVVNTGVS